MYRELEVPSGRPTHTCLAQTMKLFLGQAVVIECNNDRLWSPWHTIAPLPSSPSLMKDDTLHRYCFTIFLTTFLNDRFPFHNPSLLAKWTSVIGRDNWNPMKQSHLCSDHFTPRDYTSPDSGNLKETAVPSKFKRLPSSRIRKTEQHSGGKEIVDQGMLHGNLHWHSQICGA